MHYRLSPIFLGNKKKHTKKTHLKKVNTLKLCWLFYSQHFLYLIISSYYRMLDAKQLVFASFYIPDLMDNNYSLLLWCVLS
jgi:hypothetical protein